MLGAAAAAGIALGEPSRASAASPKLPGEVGRQINLVSPWGGAIFDHIRVSIGGDQARLFVPQGIVPGASRVPVLWLYHASGGSHDALIGGFRGIGERAVDLGMIAICQNLGGTLYSSPAATQHQLNGWNYLSAIYGIDRNFLRATSHGGAMATEVLAGALIPNVVGAHILNGVYDIVDLYLNGSVHQHDTVGEAFGHDMDLMRAQNPARHPGAAWVGKRVRVLYSQPDSSDITVPPPSHSKALIATALPFAIEASTRTHTNGHGTPGFADSDTQTTIVRWMNDIAAPDPTPVPSPIARWDFAEPAAPFVSAIAGAPALQQAPGSVASRVSTPFGGGVMLNGSTDYLRVPALEVGPLNVGASTGTVTVAAWVYSTDTNNALIAGCWDGPTGRRSYALFNDLPTYGGDNRACMHVSRTGGVTPGYPHSIDYAADPRAIKRGGWQLQVGTYDGARAVVYLDGVAVDYPDYTDPKGAVYAKNPYSFPFGLNPTPTDFLVGATVGLSRPENLHRGMIARLRVWDTALSAEDVRALYDGERAILG